MSSIGVVMDAYSIKHRDVQHEFYNKIAGQVKQPVTDHRIFDRVEISLPSVLL